MREIKFRCWSIKHRIMWFWSLGKVDFELVSELENPDSVLMQFTGLKDKNGKEVYEEDIWKDIDGHLYHITWGEHTFKFFAVQMPLPLVMIGLDSLKNGEVLGNIYENPELLDHSQGGRL